MNQRETVLNLVVKHVLIVEDAIAIQELLTELLQGVGYGVHCASNGKEAIDFLQEAQQLPGLILLDLMMPVMDGFQFREAQRKDERFAGIPVLVMTAFRDVEEKATALGASGYLKKPFTGIDTVLDAVNGNFRSTFRSRRFALLFISVRLEQKNHRDLDIDRSVCRENPLGLLTWLHSSLFLALIPLARAEARS